MIRACVEFGGSNGAVAAQHAVEAFAAQGFPDGGGVTAAGFAALFAFEVGARGQASAMELLQWFEMLAHRLPPTDAMVKAEASAASAAAEAKAARQRAGSDMFGSLLAPFQAPSASASAGLSKGGQAPAADATAATAAGAAEAAAAAAKDKAARRRAGSELFDSLLVPFPGPNPSASAGLSKGDQAAAEARAAAEAARRRTGNDLFDSLLAPFPGPSPSASTGFEGAKTLRAQTAPRREELSERNGLGDEAERAKGRSVAVGSSYAQSATFAAEASEELSAAMEGVYLDPNHPQGFRLLRVSSGVAVLTGSDTGLSPEWTLRGSVRGSILSLDFTPKGNPQVLEARFDGTGNQSVLVLVSV